MASVPPVGSYAPLSSKQGQSRGPGIRRQQRQGRTALTKQRERGLPFTEFLDLELIGLLNRLSRTLLPSTDVGNWIAVFGQ